MAMTLQRLARTTIGYAEIIKYKMEDDSPKFAQVQEKTIRSMNLQDKNR